MVDRVEILGFVLPEGNFDSWIGVAVFEGLLRLKLENVFDLLGPHDDAAFKDVGFVLFGDVVSLRQFMRRSGELSLSFDLAHRHERLREIVIELLNQIFRHQLSPLPRVLLVVQKRHENLLENPMHMLKRVFGQLHKDQDIVHYVFADLILHILVIVTNFIHQFQDYDCL